MSWRAADLDFAEVERRILASLMPTFEVHGDLMRVTGTSGVIDLVHKLEKEARLRAAYGGKPMTKLTIEAPEAPAGYEHVGEIRFLKSGETGLTIDGDRVYYGHRVPAFIIRLVPDVTVTFTLPRDQAEAMLEFTDNADTCLWSKHKWGRVVNSALSDAL